MCQAGKRQQRVNALADIVVVDRASVLAAVVAAALTCCCGPLIITPLLAIPLAVVAALVRIRVPSEALLLQLLKQAPVPPLLGTSRVLRV
jgi:hypothetical protein